MVRKQAGLSIGTKTKAKIYFSDPIIQEVLDESYQKIGERTNLLELLSEQRYSLDDIEEQQKKNITFFTIGPDKIKIGVEVGDNLI